jgi:hypothetical protein
MLLIQWTPTDLLFRAGFEVSPWLGRNPEPETRLVVVNLFPLLALRGLWRMSHYQGQVEDPKSLEITESSQSSAGVR